MTGANRRPRRKAGSQGRVRKGLVIVNTGDGKGKSTAAFGLMTRAWGRGMKVTVIQFIKQPKGQYGELLAAEKMGIEITPTGKGFTWESEDLSDDAAAARAGWKLASERILSGGYDVVILDTSPLTVVTDAAVLGTKAEGVILVARAAVTTEGALRYAVDQLGNVRAPVLGVVLNDLDFKRDGQYSKSGL